MYVYVRYKRVGGYAIWLLETARGQNAVVWVFELECRYKEVGVSYVAVDSESQRSEQVAGLSGRRFSLLVVVGIDHSKPLRRQ